MNTYRHTQIGWVSIVILGSTTAFLYWLLQVTEAAAWLLWAEIALFAVLTVLFSTLTVEVTDRTITFFFGPGFWKKQIPIEDVYEVRTVRNSVLNGFGIRYYGSGWLYCVSGITAVQIRAHGWGEVRIGTDEPDALRKAIDEARSVAV
jgi:hypothetical protein